MTIGGGASNRWVFGLEPSAAGMLGVMACPYPLRSMRLLLGAIDVRGEPGAAGADPVPSGLLLRTSPQVSEMVTETIRCSLAGVPWLLVADAPSALILSTTSIPEVTLPNSV